MVLCRFYLQGGCRFGTKCNNEHLDIKQLVKSDLEGAINGKQWPLSCFGPFKDKPCVPSFIEDQSFEEIRWLCYEAKQKNCVDQYVQHFNKEAMEANNKVKVMLQLAPHVFDIICRLYDAPADVGNNVGLAKSNVNNPFGLNDQTSVFNKPGIVANGNKTFGNGFNNHGTNSNTGNVFGSGGGSGNVGMPAGAIFGGPGFNFQNQQPSVFSSQLPKSNSIFGGGNSQNAMFGQTQSSVFGQSIQGTGLFTQTSQSQQPTANASLFPQQPQSGSNGGVFGQQSHTLATPSGGNVFNQNIQQQQQPNGGSIFSQAPQSQQIQNTSSLHLYQTNKPTSSVFTPQNAFQQQNSSNVFGQVMPTPPTSNTNNLFATQNVTTNGNAIFKNANAPAMPTQNIFAQAMQQNQQPPANIFSQPIQTSAAMQPPTGFFQQNTQTQQLGHSQTAHHQEMGENSTNQSLLQSPVVSRSIYSKLEDLTPADIEAFKSLTFTPGRIPNVPPPRELIN